MAQSRELNMRYAVAYHCNGELDLKLFGSSEQTISADLVDFFRKQKLDISDEYKTYPLDALETWLNEDFDIQVAVRKL